MSIWCIAAIITLLFVSVRVGPAWSLAVHDERGWFPDGFRFKRTR